MPSKSIFYRQTNFTGGEISPGLYGRPDVNKYQNGAKTLQNIIVQQFGGAYKRPGTVFVSSGKNLGLTNAGVRIFPFTYSTEQAYILEFGHQYLRVYKGRGAVLDTTNLVTNGTFTTDLTGWTDISTGTGSAAQSGGKAILAGGATGVGGIRQALTVTGGGQVAQITLDVATNPCTFEASYSTGSSEVYSQTLAVGSHTLTLPLMETGTTLYIKFKNANNNNSSIDNVVVNQQLIITSGATWTSDQLNEITVRQTYDELYVFHPSFAPKIITRTSHTAWTISSATFTNGPFQIENNTAITISASAGTGTSTLTASSALFTADMVGTKLKIGEPAGVLNQPFFEVNKLYAIGDYVQNDGKLYKSGSAATSKSSAPTHEAGTYNDGGSAGGGVLWQYINSGYGYATIDTFTDSTHVIATVTREIPPATVGTGTKFWSLGSFSAKYGYPRCGAFHEGRLWVGGTTGEPNSLWCSAVQDFEKFELTDEADGAGSFTLDADGVNEVRWIATGPLLLVGTAESEFTIEIPQGNITNAKAVPQANVGSPKGVQPIRVDQSLLYPQRSRQKLRELVYNFDVDGYVAPDLLLISEHLTGTYGGIQEISLQRDPVNVIWMVSTGGRLLGVTYDRSQQVVAWHQHVLGGSAIALSVASIISPNEDYYDLWVVNRRILNGNWHHFVEYLSPRLGYTNDRNLLHYSDSLLERTYATATTSISGLAHLEAATVQLLIDGSTHPDVVVADGKITTDWAGEDFVIGLPYTTVIETLPPDFAEVNNTLTGRVKKISKVILKLWNSLLCSVGQTSGNALSVSFGPPAQLGTPIPLFTGDKELVFPVGSPVSELTIYITQTAALPLNLLSLTYDLNTTGI